MEIISDLRLLTIQGGIPEAQPGPERPLMGASQGEGCLEPRSLLLGDPEGLSRPLARDGLSSGDASGGTGGISGTTDLRCPGAMATSRFRARAAIEHLTSSLP